MNNPTRTALRIVFMLALYYALQLVFLTAAMRLSVFVAARMGNVPADALEHLSDVQYLAANPAVQECIVDGRAVGMCLSALIMLLVIHFFGFYRLRSRMLRSLGGRPLLLSTLLVFAAMFALNIFVQWFPLEDNHEHLFDALSRNPLGILSMALLAPLLEEVLFRGAIQGSLMRLFGRPWPAIIVAALIFGIFHWNPIQVVYATLLGIIFGWIYYRTGSLMSVIVGHVLNNTMAVITTVAYGAAQEEAVAGSSVGIAGFLFFLLLSVLFATKLNSALPEPPAPWHEN